ncbi:MAG: HAD-IIIA family hydrolase [Betaproteobacteria bacterium]
MSRSAAFLDRDGVLNEIVLRDELVSSPRSLDEYVPAATAQHDVARLRQAGVIVVVVTNQPDIERQLIEPATVEQITAHLLEVVGVDAVMTCPHTASTGCDCRKPKPGLLIQAALAYDIDLARSWTVGDRWVDIAAGHAAGTATVLIDRDYSWSQADEGAPRPDHHAADLDAAVDLILEIERGRAR